MEKIILQNNIPLILKNNKNTPRIAFCLTMSIDKVTKYAGTMTLIKALLFQGTKTKTSEELANILENNGIECYVTSSNDLITFKILCLNDDFKFAVGILNDIVFNSTFNEIEKERTKIKGDMLSDLDSPQVQCFDMFTKTMFLNHPYGNTRTKILEEIDNIRKEDVIEFYNNILETSNKNISIVGDLDKIGTKNDIINIINNNFSELKNHDSNSEVEIPTLDSKKFVSKTKKDSVQAQIVQGWLFPPMTDKDYPAITVMNNILGSSGLSSRLFLELREKKGLAYTVRSSYESYKTCGRLWVYIGTNPINMQTAFDGFKIEIEKMKNEKVSDEELLGGKNNILGKREFVLETNLQQATSMSYYEAIGVGHDFEEKYKEQILNVTADDIKKVANKYFTNNFVLSIVAQKVNVQM